MVRSPHGLRSRRKQAIDKRRSLSADFDPTQDTMPLSSADKDVVTALVTKQLTGGEVIDQIVGKLADRLKSVVEEAVAAAMCAANKKIKDLEDVVTSLRAELHKEKVRSDDLEQYQRRTNLRVFGVPEVRDENTDQLVLDVVNTKMGLDLPLAAIDRSHRVGRRPQPGPDGKMRHRPIIVRLVSYRDRRSIFQSKKKLKGSGITIREDLTSLRQEVFQAAVKKYGLRSTWTDDGRVKWVTGGDGNRTIHTAVRLEEVK